MGKIKMFLATNQIMKGMLEITLHFLATTWELSDIVADKRWMSNKPSWKGAGSFLYLHSTRTFNFTV